MDQTHKHLLLLVLNILPKNKLHYYTQNLSLLLQGFSNLYFPLILMTAQQVPFFRTTLLQLGKTSGLGQTVKPVY